MLEYTRFVQTMDIKKCVECLKLAHNPKRKWTEVDMYPMQNKSYVTQRSALYVGLLRRVYSLPYWQTCSTQHWKRLYVHYCNQYIFRSCKWFISWYTFWSVNIFYQNFRDAKFTRLVPKQNWHVKRRHCETKRQHNKMSPINVETFFS